MSVVIRHSLLSTTIFSLADLRKKNLLFSTALLEFLPAPAGAVVIAADFGSGLEWKVIAMFTLTGVVVMVGQKISFTVDETPFLRVRQKVLKPRRILYKKE